MHAHSSLPKKEYKFTLALAGRIVPEKVCLLFVCLSVSLCPSLSLLALTHVSVCVQSSFSINVKNMVIQLTKEQTNTWAALETVQSPPSLNASPASSPGPSPQTQTAPATKSATEIDISPLPSPAADLIGNIGNGVSISPLLLPSKGPASTIAAPLVSEITDAPTPSQTQSASASVSSAPALSVPSVSAVAASLFAHLPMPPPPAFASLSPEKPSISQAQTKAPSHTPTRSAASSLVFDDID